MRLKTDENLSAAAVEVLRSAAHDVSTAPEEGLCGASDTEIARAVNVEDRVLVTFDLGFANPLSGTLPSAGVVVVRLRQPTIRTQRRVMMRLAASLETTEPVHQIWVLDETRLRRRNQVTS